MRRIKHIRISTRCSFNWGGFLNWSSYCHRLSSAFSFAFVIIQSAPGFYFLDRKKNCKPLFFATPFSLYCHFISLLFLSLFSRDLKCCVPKGSNIAGFTICTYRDKASGSYEISIVFTHVASIVCSSPFHECW